MDDTVASVLDAAFPDRDVDDIGSTGPSWNEANDTVRVDLEGSVDAPAEDKDASFWTTEPCGSSENYYSELVYWWYDWAYCKGHTDGDCVLLVTDGGGGGKCLYDHWSIACNGDTLGDLPDYHVDYGNGSEYNQMQTVYHEIGHALLSDWNFSEDEEHNMGNVHERGYYDTEPYRTPMGHGADTSPNYCGDEVVYASRAENILKV